MRSILNRKSSIFKGLTKNRLGGLGRIKLTSLQAKHTLRKSTTNMDNLTVYEVSESIVQPKIGITPRGYQLEMVGESLKRNIIVAMETGSGKTLVAILRIQAELERCSPQKMIWFCVPTVALAYQQYKAISSRLSMYQIRVLSGQDSCEFWNMKTWRGVLEGTRIIISTHKILLDALVHAFVKMEQFSLLVFDEAHRATKGHPANVIMRDFYHLGEQSSRPCILGLTASPILNNSVENILAPRINASELQRCTNLPELTALTYDSGKDMLLSQGLNALSTTYDNYDMDKDPWIVKMRADESTRSSPSLHKALLKMKTWCRDQLRTFHVSAKTIYSELGASASDMFISSCIKKFKARSSQSFSVEKCLEDLEQEHLMTLLDPVLEISIQQSEEEPRPLILSSKLEKLIEFLGNRDCRSFTGLVFVRTRAEVAVMPGVLSRHPQTSQFAISTFVGESESASRRSAISELADIRNQKTTLDDLRQGRKNLVITTNALEEGIDVSACNHVICFEKPPNLRSFIQRRGRARKDVSTYAVMLERGHDTSILQKFHELEAEMKRMYQDDMRKLDQLKRLEHEDLAQNREFEVESTGAKISLTDAVGHLYHFCSTLSADPYADRTPLFQYQRISGSGKAELISAEVLLPCSVDASVRVASSAALWKSEKGARRDAAFEAYVALYKAGLIDDHLLPLGKISGEVEAALAEVEKRPNLLEVADQINAWSLMAPKWNAETGSPCPTLVTIKQNGEIFGQITMLSPAPLGSIEEFKLYWPNQEPFTVIASEIGPGQHQPSREIGIKSTKLLLQSVFTGRLDGRDDFTILFCPCDTVDVQGMECWLSDKSGTVPALNESSTTDALEIGLIRNKRHGGSPYIFETRMVMTRQELLQSGMIEEESGRDVSGSVFLARRLAKKIELLHEDGNGCNIQREPVARTMLLAEDCEIDRLPARYSLIASFLPSILHVVHKSILVDTLCQTLLEPLNMQDTNLIATAISASSAREPDNYQRLEFLGDCILKFLTSLSLASGNLNYHEGILSHMKDHIVSNGNLSKMSIELGLDQFIVTRPFQGKKWRPTYNSDFPIEGSGKKREMSTKTLADVVESLVGAAFLDGGLNKSVKCLEILIPGRVWTDPSTAAQILRSSYPEVTVSHPNDSTLAILLGQDISLPLLIYEALTHPSFRQPLGVGTTTASYQRLEYLGDAILDYIVTTAAFNHDPPIPVPRLHLIRAALVNGDYLGYLCLAHSTPVESIEVDSTDKDNITTFTTARPFYLWQAMRTSAAAVSDAQKECYARFLTLQPLLASHFHPSRSSASLQTRYPWTLLSQLIPPKFFSDIIESLIGALWIDSHGSIDTCRRFLDVLGWTAYLNVVLERQGEGLLHPKEELGRLAVTEKVRYDVFMIETRSEESEEEVKELGCRVFVGEAVVAEARGGRERLEVETRAAEQACEVLRQQPRSTAKAEEDDGDGSFRKHDDVVESEQGQEMDIDDGEHGADDHMSTGDLEESSWTMKRKRKHLPSESLHSSDEEES